MSSKFSCLSNNLLTHSSPPSNPTHTQTLRNKVKQLEKDLYYYKKTSRDLRKKLRQEGGTNDSATPLSLQSMGSSTASVLNADSAVKDSIETSVIAVDDSLSSVRSGTLTAKGSESETSVRVWCIDS